MTVSVQTVSCNPHTLFTKNAPKLFNMNNTLSTIRMANICPIHIPSTAMNYLLLYFHLN
ncbi:hypothetical protein ID866_8801 [Astraeus odoratus]|nr:hypothetical protein ID866_8801 [Astraeus odoratus]